MEVRMAKYEASRMTNDEALMTKEIRSPNVQESLRRSDFISH